MTIKGNILLGTKVLKNSAVLDFGSITPSTGLELTVNVPGAVSGDYVILGLPSGLEAGLIVNGRVSSNDTVTVRVSNITAGAIDPASATYKVMVLQ